MSTAPNDVGTLDPAKPDQPAKTNGNPLPDSNPNPVTEREGGEPNPSFRGPLRYEVETSTAQLEAGTSFSIFIKITNPYDEPVEVLSAQTELPVEFMDAEEEQPGWFGFGRSEEAAPEGAPRKRSQSMRATVLSAAPVSGRAESVGGGGRGWPAVLLQPGNSTLYEFKLRTSRWLFFMPSVYNLHVQVQYKMEGAINYDTVKHQMNIRAPLRSLLCGSVAGAWVGTNLAGLLGNLAAGVKFWPTVSFNTKFMASLLLGAVLVVAFARKKDAQPFLSIEDFYGGAFIGFLAAWVGPSLLKSLLPAL